MSKVLFTIYHPYSNGNIGFLQYIGCLSNVRNNNYHDYNVYKVYIKDNILYSFRQDKIINFLKNTLGYKIFLKDYRNGLEPALDIFIYETEVKIIYIDMYSLSYKEKHKNEFLFNIETAYNEFNS